MAAEDEVLYEVIDEEIALITLNRPDRMNALTNRTCILYFDYLNKANRDNNIKVIIVTGQGKRGLVYCIYLMVLIFIFLFLF